MKSSFGFSKFWTIQMRLSKFWTIFFPNPNYPKFGQYFFPNPNYPNLDNNCPIKKAMLGGFSFAVAVLRQSGSPQDEYMEGGSFGTSSWKLPGYSIRIIKTYAQ